MAWETWEWCNLTFDNTQQCHHHKNDIFCEQSDFDALNQVQICGRVYLTTKQGNQVKFN